MKKVYSLIITLFIFMFGLVGSVYADDECSSAKRAEYNKLANAITASYDFVYDDNKNVIGFSINVYNVPNELSISYKTTPDKYNISGGFTINDGVGFIIDNNLEDIYTYTIDIYSKARNCSQKLKTLKVTKPKRNELSKSVYCLYDGFEDVDYCQEWTTKNFNRSLSDVDKELKNQLDKTTTTTGTSVCVNCNEIESTMFNLKDFFKRNKLVFIVAIILAIILDVLTIILMIKNSKEGEL